MLHSLLWQQWKKLHPLKFDEHLRQEFPILSLNKNPLLKHLCAKRMYHSFQIFCKRNQSTNVSRHKPVSYFVSSKSHKTIVETSAVSTIGKKQSETQVRIELLRNKHWRLKHLFLPVSNISFQKVYKTEK